MAPTSALAAPVLRIRADRVDFEALYRGSRDDVYAYVFSMLRDAAGAEDVTALAFEKAMRRESSFDARRGTQRAWLFGIARNAALDELRRRSRLASLTAEPADSDGAATADEAEKAVSRAAVRSALASLEARERELVALKFHAGLDNAELASVLGVSVSAAGTQLHRVITKLRKAVDADA